MAVSLMTRHVCIAAIWPFQRCNVYTEGALVVVLTNELAVPASKLHETMKRIKQLEATRGRKTLENDIRKEGVDYAKPKIGLRTRRLFFGTPSAAGI